jgi:hypothetical protein
MIIRNHTTNYPTQRRRVRRGIFSTRCLRPQRRAVTARGRRVFSLTVHFLSRIGICRSLRSRAVMARLCVRKTISWQKTSLRTLRLCVVFKGLVVRLRIIIKDIVLNFSKLLSAKYERLFRGKKSGKRPRIPACSTERRGLKCGTNSKYH